MRIGEAVANLGIEEPDDRDLCVVVFKDGRPKHAPLRRVADRDIAEFGDVYLASGTFGRDAIRPTSGRSEENLKEILWLPFDADLTDALGWEKAWVHELPQERLWERIDGLREDLEEVFASLHLPIHRLDYTGYGLAAYIRVAPEIAGRVAELRAVHRSLVARINEAANGRLVDPQVSDAGTRIMRLVPCLNTKGQIARETREIYRRDGEIGAAELQALGQRAALPRPVTRIIPDHGNGLAAEDLEALAEAIRPHWVAGVRHELALGIAAMCAKAGMPESQCGELVIGLAAGDDELWDRQQAVRTSYDRVRSGLEARGFMRLRNVLPDPALAYVDGILGKLRMATSPRILVSGERQRGAGHGHPTPVQDRYQFAPPPASAFYGWFGRYLALVEPSTEAADAFHLGASLTVAAATIGRRVGVRYISRTVYPNLYSLVVGPAGGSRKDTAIEFAIYVVDQFDFNPTGRNQALRSMPYKLATDIGSAEGLIKLLGENGNTLLYLTEFSKLQRNAKRQSTNTIVPTLIQAWNNPRSIENNVKGSPIKAEYPSLSIIAAVQPGVLAAGMEDEDVTSGFMTRWMFFPGVGKEPRPLPPDLDQEALRSLYGELLDNIAGYGTAEQPSELSLSAEAKQRWIAWYSEDNRRQTRNEQEDTMRTRLGPLAQKVSLIYAVSDGASEIRLEHLNAAIDLIEWMWSQVLPLMGDWGAGTDLQIEERIRAVLKQHGAMKRWQLQAKCSNRKWSSKDFAVVFDAMVKNGTVLVDPTGLCGLVEGA